MSERICMDKGLQLDRNNIAKIAREKYSNSNMTKRYLQEYDKEGRKNRILLIDVNCKNSSTGKIVYDLYKAVKVDDRDAAICYGRGKLIREKGIFKFGLNWETYIHALLARITGFNGCFSFFSTQRLIRYIKKFKPDMIHIHELHAYFVNIGQLLRYINKKRIPIVWTFHCEYMYTGKCGHAYECKGFQNKCGNCPQKKEYPKSLFFDRTEKMLKKKMTLLNNLKFTIVTPSEWGAERVKLSFLKNKEVIVIHNGVDTSIFRQKYDDSFREKINIPNENKICLFVSPDVSDKRKGAQWIMKLAQHMENEKYTFIIIGGGEKPDEYPTNMLYVGKITDANVLARYYNIADVFLLLSEKETYSMTCAEALCCGTPVVGFKCGAPEKVFKDGGAKFVEYGNIELVKDIINQIG